ncbi:MAG TPA: MgtC/SapB family protein [Fluviicola sp.]|nr:MgtC/SapB family protein [Fluviicola sp.]
MLKEFDFLIKMLPEIFVATACGTIVGIDREIKNKAAGIRTHVLICVGATIFTLVGISFGHGSDPTRVIGQIITGIGFLGGGVIFKQSDRLVGITSAAFIWFIAAIGVLCGLGYLISAGILTVGFVLITNGLKYLEQFVEPKQKTEEKEPESKAPDEEE